MQNNILHMMTQANIDSEKIQINLSTITLNTFDIVQINYF